MNKRAGARSPPGRRRAIPQAARRKSAGKQEIKYRETKSGLSNDSANMSSIGKSNQDKRKR
jgi:hypothetical protein